MHCGNQNIILLYKYPVCQALYACHQERHDDKLPLSDVAQPWLRWWWLFGWQAGESSFGSESQYFLTLHREESESLKWLSATFVVKLLGISKFTPAAVHYHIQVLEMCTFLNHWEWEKTKANINLKRIKLWLAFWLNFNITLTVESKFVPVDEKKKRWLNLLPLFHWGLWHPDTAKATLSFNFFLLSIIIHSMWRLLLA